jgi:hypothetical protein
MLHNISFDICLHTALNAPPPRDVPQPRRAPPHVSQTSSSQAGLWPARSSHVMAPLASSTTTPRRATLALASLIGRYAEEHYSCNCFESGW